ncbi:unnamed protein product [Rhizophagus irregularis]|nr:unnamed protein product [Rhizophagus irregularis]
MDESLMRPAISEYLKNYVSTSKVHRFKNLHEPRNATEAFHSKAYDFVITNNIEDFDKSVNQNDNVIKDDDEIPNNSNFHPKEQSELELPDDILNTDKEQ